jgi:hypothetical protein
MQYCFTLNSAQQLCATDIELLVAMQVVICSRREMHYIRTILVSSTYFVVCLYLKVSHSRFALISKTITMTHVFV